MVGYCLLYNVDLQLLNYQNEVNTIDNLVFFMASYIIQFTNQDTV